MLKPLPVGIQTFRDIIEGGFLYVDKTPWIYDMIRYPKGMYFVSRPRRFGKSLLLSTLKEIFEGNRDLFRGLWLYDSDYNWQPHPVIRLDFSLHQADTAAELKQSIARNLIRIARQYEIELEGGEYYGLFEDLIFQLATRNKVVVLIDEYDKPIIDHIEDTAKARRMRDVLRGFYTIIKGMDEYLRFVLLTGVSKFSKVGVFSGLNNLKDITLDDRFSALLGMTQQEVEENFGGYIDRLAEKKGIDRQEVLSRIAHWYDGFCFSKQCLSVYNPFSILLVFDAQDFRNFWFETGTPTFLIRLIKKKRYDIRRLDHLEIDELAFSSYNVDNLRILPLLFQTGYLTIKGYTPETRLYRLGYPNYEVENAFLHYLLADFSPVDNGETASYLWQLIGALRQQDFETFFEVLQTFFAGIPYDIQIRRERYYQTVFYLIFKLLGLRVGAEVRTRRGRIDAVIELEEGVFLFEFKLDGDAEAALAQIKERGYAEPYRQPNRDVYLIGVGFDLSDGRIAAWQVDRFNVFWEDKN
ncbi:MAG TPA: AAA family ATPase [Anaerolineae bacterium]|nr:AAA family ATPase [Anaerolineae bacterium]